MIKKIKLFLVQLYIGLWFRYHMWRNPNPSQWEALWLLKGIELAFIQKEGDKPDANNKT